MKSTYFIILVVSLILLSLTCTKTTSRGGSDAVSPIVNNDYSEKFKSSQEQHRNIWEEAASNSSNNSYRLELIVPPGAFILLPDSLIPLAYFVYTLPETCDVKIKIRTSGGKDVDSEDFGVKSPGSYRIRWQNKKATNTDYVITLFACNTTLTKKITLSK